MRVDPELEQDLAEELLRRAYVLLDRQGVEVEPNETTGNIITRKVRIGKLSVIDRALNGVVVYRGTRRRTLVLTEFKRTDEIKWSDVNDVLIALETINRRMILEDLADV
jgi:hypothetical protein